jgi:hypothetical protein
VDKKKFYPLITLLGVESLMEVSARTVVSVVQEYKDLIEKNVKEKKLEQR